MSIINIFSSPCARLEKALHKRLGKDRKTEVFEQIGSTNTYLKNLSKKQNGQLCVALNQTGGRGRGNKPFLSFGEGLYMSALYLPKKKLRSEESVKITCSAAVAVCESIRSITSLDAKIKWVNDIYISDKKVCGILTEGKVGDDGCFEYFVLGVGVNLRAARVPCEIGHIASSLYGENEKMPKNILPELCAEIVERFEECFKNSDKAGLLKKYREYSMLYGREIELVSAVETCEALVLDICDDFSLEVKHKDGNIQRLNSGEISLKII